MNGVLVTKGFVRRSHNAVVMAYISTPTTYSQSNTTSSLLCILVQPALDIFVDSPGLYLNSSLPLLPFEQSYWQSRCRVRPWKPDCLEVDSLETLVSVLE
jgi:hypothetical protein